MFQDCQSLENVPIFNVSSISSVSGMNNMFSKCKNLTTTSLDNILQMCIGATSYPGTKKLSTLAINNTFVNYAEIPNLPHYQDFLNAGWTI